MAGKRRYIPASEFCASVRDGTHDSPKPVQHGRRLVTSRHLTGGRLDLSDAYLISQEDFETINKRSKVNQWDVLISMIGTVGEVCLIKDEPDFAIKNIGLFKTKSEADGRWLYYFLRSKSAQQTIRAQSRGTTQQYIPLGALRDFPVLIVDDREEQKAIAKVLGSLDDKIDSNWRMNATLEAMARTLFQSWFVDFEPVHSKIEGRPLIGLDQATAALFPSAFQDSSFGPIPLGWRVATVAETCETIFSGGTPNTQEPNFWGGNFSWLSSGETRSPFIIETEKTITKAGIENSSTRLARAGCTVIAGAGQGHTRGQTSLLTFESYINQSVIALTANAKVSSDLFLFFDLARRYEEFRQLSDSHSSRGSLTTKLLAGVKCVLPSREIVAAFDKAVAPVVAQIIANLRQSRTLATLRDTLLPKLLSGELPITAISSSPET